MLPSYPGVPSDVPEGAAGGEDRRRGRDGCKARRDGTESSKLLIDTRMALDLQIPEYQN